MSILTFLVGLVLLTVTGVTAVSIWLAVKAWRAGRRAYHSIMDTPNTSYGTTRPRSSYSSSYSPYVKEKESNSGGSLGGYAASAGAGLLAGALIDRSLSSGSSSSSSDSDSSSSSNSCASVGSGYSGGDSGGGGASSNSCASSSSCSSSSGCGGGASGSF